jgi:hypothetical protein
VIYFAKINVLQIFGGNDMKHQHSKIGKYGLRWKPVEGYKTKKGKKIPTAKSIP